MSYVRRSIVTLVGSLMRSIVERHRRWSKRHPSGRGPDERQNAAQATANIDPHLNRPCGSSPSSARQTRGRRIFPDATSRGYVEAMPDDAGSLSNGMARAIGLVAMASARLDDQLRYLLSDLAGSEQIWPLFEGQGTEWLIESTRMVMQQGARLYDVELRPSLTETLADGKRLQPIRNTVIHGVWSTTTQYRLDDEDENYRPKARPWGQIGDSDDPVFYCHRSRHRRYDPDHMFTVGDVMELGLRFEVAAFSIESIRHKRGVALHRTVAAKNES